MKDVGMNGSHLLLEWPGQIVERHGHVGMVRPKHLLLNAESAEVQSLRVRVITLPETQRCF